MRSAGRDDFILIPNGRQRKGISIKMNNQKKQRDYEK